MSAKFTADSPAIRYESLDTLPAAPPLTSDVRALSDEEIERRATSDADAGSIPPGFWDHAQIIEPEGTEQITLRLPRGVIRHFKATGKGYQSRISSVLASYVAAQDKRQR